MARVGTAGGSAGHHFAAALLSWSRSATPALLFGIRLWVAAPRERREAGMAKGRAVAIVLDDMQKAALTALTRKHGAPQSLAVRARIALS